MTITKELLDQQIELEERIIEALEMEAGIRAKLGDGRAQTAVDVTAIRVSVMRHIRSRIALDGYSQARGEANPPREG